MAGMKKVLGFPCGFFLGIIAPLHLKELYGLLPRDTVLLVQYLDQMLWI
jgi:hypothetical protein